MFVKLNDLNVNYEVSGNGPPLVLLHGGGLDLISWEDMVPHLERDFTVYRMDLRGLGKTERPPQPHLSMPLWASDLRAFLEHFDLTSPSLVGWSMGGGIILEYASTWPTSPKHIVLLGAQGPLGPPPDRSGFYRRQELIRAGKSPDEVIEETFDFTKAAFSQHSIANNPRSVERIKEGLKRNFSFDYAEMVDALRARDLSGKKLDLIGCPTLIVVGDADARTPLPMSEDLNKAISGSYLKILPNCGHYYGYEYPERSSQLIREFVTAFS